MNKAEEEKLDLVFDAVKLLEASNLSVLESVNKVLHIHIGLKNGFELLLKRVTEIDFTLESFVYAGLPANVEEISNLRRQIVDL